MYIYIYKVIYTYIYIYIYTYMSVMALRPYIMLYPRNQSLILTASAFYMSTPVLVLAGGIISLLSYPFRGLGFRELTLISIITMNAPP